MRVIFILVSQMVPCSHSPPTTPRMSTVLVARVGMSSYATPLGMPTRAELAMRARLMDSRLVWAWHHETADLNGGGGRFERRIRGQITGAVSALDGFVRDLHQAVRAFLVGRLGGGFGGAD